MPRRVSTRRHGRPQDARSGKADRDAATKAVLDNMAKLKALRLAREAAEPPAPVTVKKAAPNRKASARKARRPHWATGWQTSRAADAAPEAAAFNQNRRHAGRPFDHRSRLGLGVIDLHLQHLVFVLQRHARLFGGFDGIVVRLEVTVHDQRVSLVGALSARMILRGCCSSASIVGFFIFAPCDRPV